MHVQGEWYRLDVAWPASLVALEADGHEFHGGCAAFIRDHRRLGSLAAAGWRVLPLTWSR